MHDLSKQNIFSVSDHSNQVILNSLMSQFLSNSNEKNPLTHICTQIYTPLLFFTGLSYSAVVLDAVIPEIAGRKLPLHDHSHTIDQTLPDAHDVT